MPSIDWFVDVQTGKGIGNFLGNWHSTMAEAMMALGILADDRARYNKGVKLYHATVADYLKWGRGSTAYNRILGECTETMRDMYHAQFGLGGLLQAAEIAWQPDEDLYSSNDFALAAALELHARINLAYISNKDPSKLPPGYKFYDAMPPAPAGTRWQLNIGKQMWSAVDTRTGAWVSDLNDGIKYMLGVGFLPTGWEMGYNHYVGRLGMKLPETAALLARSWPEWQEFHWGLGTLTHANSAQYLWRSGITATSLCTTGIQSNTTLDSATGLQSDITTA
eukprot:GHRR01023758.1.p2 GENE.GHRR01023758.1~~GHRR01023758.1.p2  ORF type:complete len:279 (+),score=87.28 GHRR01023758.1:1347-2183(+)